MFNVADIYVTLATIVLLYILFFALKERELDYIICSKKKWDAITDKNYDDDKKEKHKNAKSNETDDGIPFKVVEDINKDIEE